MDVKANVVKAVEGVKDGTFFGVLVDGRFYPYVEGKLIVPRFPIEEVDGSVYEYIWAGIQVVEKNTGQEFAEVVRKTIEFMKENGLWHIEHTEIGNGVVVKLTYKDGAFMISVSSLCG